MVKAEKITKLHELLKLIEKSLDASAGPRWFRGSGSHLEYKLIPSLFRHPDVLAGNADPLDLEDRLTARFTQTSPPFLTARPNSKFDWMFTAQHFGVPTRLLDWTENPFIAMYFALSSSSSGKTPCIWMLDPMLWTKKSLNNTMLARIPDTSDGAATTFLESLSDPIGPRIDPIAIFSNHTNPRVVAQRGTFTLFGRGVVPMEDIAYADECLRCFTIDPTLKESLHKKLLSIGYTHSVVYPDLSGLGVELKTSFGF